MVTDAPKKVTERRMNIKRKQLRITITGRIPKGRKQKKLPFSSSSKFWQPGYGYRSI
jgi:hypothetical protein